MKMSQIYERTVYIKTGIDPRDPKVIRREQQFKRLAERQQDRLDTVSKAVENRLKVVK